MSPVSATDLDAFRSLHAQVLSLRVRLMNAEAGASSELATVNAAYRPSAANLLDYLVARQVDLRPLQMALGRYGLSSLGRIEGHVRDALEQVLARLEEALSSSGAVPPTEPRRESAAPTSDEADQLLHQHTRDLFGPKPPDRHVYVMVTAPDASEVDEAWVARVLDAGMNVLRVNAAHEDAAEWHRIVATARRVASARAVSLRVLVDLPGPKLRTVALGSGPRVERWKPHRDEFGRVTAPCRIRLFPEGTGAAKPEPPELEIPRRVWSQLEAGDRLSFRDTRGKERRVEITERTDDYAIGLLRKTTYIVAETLISLKRGGQLLGEFRPSVTEQPFELTLAVGDRFELRSAPLRADALAGPLPVMGCSLPEALFALVPGARVLFDDGKLECVVESRAAGGVVLRATRAPSGVFRLGAEKGINLPGTPLGGPALGPDDERALAFALTEADLIGASFVRGPEDIRTLYARLEQLGAQQLGVILKIETAAAFRHLPVILLAAMTRYPVGVMIARGDLAVEAGFERLAELQEEILWLCEAAHLPVIWATQVLDRLAHTGTATRAEVTDAAMGVRAECVMLNKGPYIVQAATTLIDILRRMEHHQYKKRSLYRRLRFDVPTNVPKAGPGVASVPAEGL